jgi:hypothetical protein
MTEVNKMKRVAMTAVIWSILVLLSACADSDNGVSRDDSSGSTENTDNTDNTDSTNSTSGEAPPGDLKETLGRLGVDTAETPRIDDYGNEYPDSYAPLGTVIAVRHFPDSDEPDGTRFVLGRAEELLMLGFRPDAQPGIVSVIDDLSSGTASDGFTLSDTLFERTEAQAPWAVERNTGGSSANGPRVVQGTRRDAAAGDFNGDGFRESAMVYFAELADGSTEVRLLVTDSRSPADLEVDIALSIDPAMFPINDLRVVAGDFDGDQLDEIAIAIAREPDVALPSTPVGVFIVDDAPSGFRVTNIPDTGIATSLVSPHVTLVIENANLDYDINSELVVVVNENTVGPSFPGTFATQYLVLEHEDDAWSTIAGGSITAEIDGRDISAVVADVATGDLDGDSLDEIIFGGLEEIVGNCNSPDESIEGLKHTIVALGNKSNDFSVVGASALALSLPNCNETGFLLRFTHINTLDFDGDGDVDIQLNTRIFDSVPNEDWTESLLGEINDSSVILGTQEQGKWFDRSNSVMMTSDQTGDAVDDIITLYLDPEQPYLKVWSCSADPDTGKCDVTLATRVALWPEDMDTNFGINNNTSHVNPVVVAVDVDNDDITLYKYNQDHFLDFSEPLVIAALAAPPCEDGIGQDLGACTTTWGSASSATVERTFSLGIKGAVSFGSGTAGAGVIAKSKHTISVAAQYEFSKAYELTRSLAFTTGPTEDSVVFVAVPIDRYGYTVISSTSPEDLGSTFYVDLPRDLIMLIATAEYYNANVQPDALKIDSRVFQHVPGRLSSYPTADDKDRILATQKSRLEEARFTLFDPILSRFDPVEVLGGLEVGPISVGEGSGSTELALEYVESKGQANSIEVAYEYEAETAAGVLVGFSVGVSAERSLTSSHGESTIYAGSIGSIDKDFFGANRYSYGLFAYVQAEQGQEFEVLNYWVELD